LAAFSAAYHGYGKKLQKIYFMMQLRFYYLIVRYSNLGYLISLQTSYHFLHLQVALVQQEALVSKEVLDLLEK
jgi:hypothetical protein